MSMTPSPPLSPAQCLRWYLDAGVDEAIGERPVDRFRLPAKPSAVDPHAMPPQAAVSVIPAAAVHHTSAHIALACRTLAELKAAMEAYDGCALKRTCQRTVFADGNPEAQVMLVGEAPGADEDRLGLPFVGASGRLLDHMLASIGLDRQSVYIANVVPWRPPGNRKPEPTEIELCLPFIQRQIELVDPAVLILLGGAPTSALLARQDAISRLRGRWVDYSSPRLARPIPAMPTYHPAYLLRTPLHKREAWRDLLAVRKRLESTS
jgi:DNA polymerase